MSAFDQRAPASSRSLSGPPLGCAAGVALAAAIEFLVRHIAPEAPAILGLGLAGLAGLAVIALAFTLEDEALPNLTRAVLAGMGLIVLGALADPEARLRLFSFASAAFGVGLTVWLARTARRRPRVSLGMAALFAAALAGLSAYAAVLVLASRDLMIADFMTYRGIAIMVARLADAGNWPLLMSAAVESITQNYSWAPALAPGVMLALTAPTSRALYTVALLALYAAPALLALAILARDLARRGGLALSPSPQPSPKGRGGANGRRQSPSPFGGRWREAPDEGALALGVAAVFVAYPAAMAVAARGMPDVGGLVLTVCALRLAERLARLLALPKGRDARVAPMTRRVALALPLTMFAMFAFRRWYAFAAAGIAIVLAIEIASIALGKGARFPWKDAVAAAALGLLTLLALMSPVIVDWLPNLSAHDYASAYAAYRKPLAVFLARARRLGRSYPRARRLGRGGVPMGALPRPAPVAADPRRHGRRRRALFAHPDALYPSSRSDRAGDRCADRRLVDAHLRARAARRAGRPGRAWRSDPLAARGGAQSVTPGADRRTAARVARAE